MSENHVFAREEVFPSWFANRIQDYLSAGQMDLPLSLKSSTILQIVPDANIGIAAVNIEGRWRFITSAIERAHPGGAKGTYHVWAVAEDNSVNNTPDPFTDHTVYKFELRITSGAKPTGEGTAISTKIGEVDWSGTEVEALRQTRGVVSGAQIADGALSGTGDIEWKRLPSGAWIPQLKASSVGTGELAATSVTEGKVGDGAVTSRKFKPTAGVKQASTDLTLTNAYQDVALTGGNLVITPVVASTLLIFATFDMRWDVASDKEGECIGTMRLDAADQTPVARHYFFDNTPAAQKYRVTVSQSYALALTVAEHTIKMRAKFLDPSTGAGSLEADNTRFTYLLIAS